MPITALDHNTALVVIDMQKGIVTNYPTVHPAKQILAQVVRLVDAFRAKARPVALVRVGWAPGRPDMLRARTQAPPPGQLPPDFFEFMPELRADADRDIFIHKRQWGAFYGTDLELHLRRRGITNIVLCGISTSIGVESTARNAWERGYNLSFASDAMTDTIAENHNRAIESIFPRIGEIGTTDEILTFV